MAYKLISAGLITVLLFSGCASQGKPGASSSTHALSADEAQEVAIGQQLHAAVLSSFTPYTDPKVTDYVERVGNALAEQSERRELPYHFTVLYSDKIYAASSPGGFVYLTTGMLYFIENEAELAAVLAHEIAQLQYRDPKNTRASKVLDSVTKSGAMVGPAFGQIGVLAMLGLMAVNSVSQPHLLNSEQKLIQADKKAMTYMMQAGQDPQGMVDLFYKFLKSGNEKVPYFYDYYQSRPITEKRFEALNKNFSKLPLHDKNFNTHRQVYQDSIRGVQEIYKQ